MGARDGGGGRHALHDPLLSKAGPAFSPAQVRMYLLYGYRLDPYGARLPGPHKCEGRAWPHAPKGRTSKHEADFTRSRLILRRSRGASTTNMIDSWLSARLIQMGRHRSSRTASEMSVIKSLLTPFEALGSGAMIAGNGSELLACATSPFRPAPAQPEDGDGGLSLSPCPDHRGFPVLRAPNISRKALGAMLPQPGRRSG